MTNECVDAWKLGITLTCRNSLRLALCVSCVAWLSGQVCDKFAAAGFNVAMPDFCDGKHWLVKDFPPADMQVSLFPWNSFVHWLLLHTVVAYIVNIISSHERAGRGGGGGGPLS